MRLSMIGYSMGGLMNRYTAGKLFAEGVFDEGGVTPVNFITGETGFRANLCASCAPGDTRLTLSTRNPCPRAICYEL